MQETVDIPDEYVAERAEGYKEDAGIDVRIARTDVGEEESGTQPGTKEQRAERWERLTTLYTELRGDIKDSDQVLQTKCGHLTDAPADGMEFPYGFSIVTHIEASSLDAGAGVLPEEVTEKTRHSELRLVDTRVGSRPPLGTVLRFTFALPPMEPEESSIASRRV